jgi:AhpD family alkylhydroperoxidase
MDNQDIEKIEKIIKDRKIAHGFYLKNSQVYQAFTEMEQRAFANGDLDKKYKELIAIGISIIINCESCLEWHIKEALASGASEKQIIEAIGVGIEMGGGPSTVSSRFALKVLEYYRNQTAIREISSEEELIQSVQIIREAFATVAEDFNLNETNCPTNPAFTSIEKLREMKAKGLILYGLFINNHQTGFVAIEKADQSLFYMERLAVLPKFRHAGLGKKLIDFVFEYVKKERGAKLSIGIINENIILKKWYQEYGFSETALKKYPHLPFTVCIMEKNI